MKASTLLAMTAGLIAGSGLGMLGEGSMFRASLTQLPRPDGADERDIDAANARRQRRAAKRLSDKVKTGGDL